MSGDEALAPTTQTPVHSDIAKMNTMADEAKWLMGCVNDREMSGNKNVRW